MLIVSLLAAAALCQPGPAIEGQVTYFEVPLKGEVGKEITAPGVRDAIKAAAGKKATCIVFILDTPGGRVADADLIAQVMDRERGGLKYYAIVNKAISAAVWPLSRMDRVFLAPGSATGAAVAFSVSGRSGSAEVDAKMNAALTASRMYEGKAEVVKVAPVDHKLDTRGIAREASQTLSRIRSERVRSRV